MKTRNLVLAVCCALFALLAVPALADHHEGHDETPAGDPMMEAMMKAAMPGEAHTRLASTAGDWKLTTKMWMDPTTEPMVTEMTAHREMMMDGRYLREAVEGDFMGMPFVGQSIVGYDNVTGKYWSTWMDNMSTGVMVQTGTYDADTHTTTFVGESPDPMTGAMVKNRTVMEHVSADKEIMTMYMTQGGEEIKTMEIVWTRAH
jgi:hypothetical protein